MGLLDDLRNQADNQRANEQAEAERKAAAEVFYREKIEPLMVKTYQYFKELIEHINYIKLETYAEYPLLPNGKTLRLRQQDYKVLIDSSKALKQIDFTLECALDSDVPVQFDVFGRDPVMMQVERIERYSAKYERKNRKGPDGELESARFIIEGPIPMKLQVRADVDASEIKLMVRNFIEPGFHNYSLKVEQFDDAFLDRLGKYILRQEQTLFDRKEEIPEDVRKKLRDRLIVEQRLREQEMREAEQRRLAEEAAELEKTAKQQIKRAINNTVNENKEKLRGMFNKLKQQAGLGGQSEQDKEARLRAALDSYRVDKTPDTTTDKTTDTKPTDKK